MGKETLGEDGTTTVTHYHYDTQGRLIEETDGRTGAVIRSHVWLGLQPVATLGAERDTPADPDGCESDLLADVEARVAARTSAWESAAVRLSGRDGQPDRAAGDARLAELEI